jgi:hypothetical protein
MAVLFVALGAGFAASGRAQDGSGGGRSGESSVPVELVNAFFPDDLAQHLPANGGWLPLYVELRARGDKPENVTLEAVVQRTTDKEKVIIEYETRSRFEVPPGQAPRRAWLYVWVKPGESFQHTVQLRYLSGGQSVPIGSVGNGGSVFVDSDQEGIFPMFVVGGDKDQVSPWGENLSTKPDLQSDPWISKDAVERLEAHQLPDRILGYHAVRQVVLRGVDETRLEPAQIAALRQWVYLGGSLIFSPEKKSDKIFGGALFKEIFGDVLAPEVKRDDEFRPQNLYMVEREHGAPLRTDSYVETELVKLRDEDQAFSLMDPFVDSPLIVREIRSFKLASLEPKDERAVDPLADYDLKRGEFPGARVYAEVRFGAGRVGALTIDEETFQLRDSKPLRQALWQKIIQSGQRSGASRWQVRLIQNGVHDAMKDEKRDVGTFLIGGIIVVYLLLVGPGVYFFLKRKNKLPSIIWVEPAVIVVYVGIIFALGYLTKGYLTKVRMVTLYYQREGEPFALRDSYLSIFSADDIQYQIDCPRGEILAPVFANENERTSVEGSQGQGGGGENSGDRRLALRGYHLDLWQQGVVMNSGIETIAGKVTVERIEDDAGGKPRYRVKNGLPWAIRGGRLHPKDSGGFVGTNGLEVGEIPSGASQTIDADDVPATESELDGEEHPVLTREIQDRFDALNKRGLAYSSKPMLWALLDRSEDLDFRVDRAFTLSQKLDFYLLYAN